MYIHLGIYMICMHACVYKNVFAYVCVRMCMCVFVHIDMHTFRVAN